MIWHIAKLKLWFGDERGYNATRECASASETPLWFGDERGYNATQGDEVFLDSKLWFGDERGYNATYIRVQLWRDGCGLVMKEDITQLRVLRQPHHIRCGLVMKEDITQLTDAMELARVSCGLVMKEDITQQLISLVQGVLVVVW